MKGARNLVPNLVPESGAYHLRSMGAAPRSIGIDDVRKLLADDSQLVEVLPEPEHTDLHLPGAINIPLKQLDRDTTAQLDRSRPVIVYCHDGL